MSRHRYLHLSDTPGAGVHRPDLSVWADSDDDGPKRNVALCIGALMGQQQRFLDLTPEEARKLADLLVAAAYEAEKVPGDTPAENEIQF